MMLNWPSVCSDDHSLKIDMVWVNFLNLSDNQVIQKNCWDNRKKRNHYNMQIRTKLFQCVQQFANEGTYPSSSGYWTDLRMMVYCWRWVFDVHLQAV